MEQSRLEAQQAFVNNNGWSNADLFPLPADASTRTYTRLIKDGESRLLMDSPSESEKLSEFIQISEHLIRLGLRAPKVFASDVPAGLALVEDFGENTFTRLLNAGAEALPLYLQAADVLIHLHHAGADAVQIDLPTYNMDTLLREAELFIKWFVPAARGEEVSVSEEETFFAVWRDVLSDVSKDKSAFVLRDFHVDNLMIVPESNSLRACGLLDFQDALLGPVAYDMVSLLEDARRDVPTDIKNEVLDHYFGACPTLDRTVFETEMKVLGAQRHAKVAGIFVRLSVLGGKHVYLQHLPRVLTLLQNSLASPVLDDVRFVMEKLIPELTDQARLISLTQKIQEE